MKTLSAGNPVEAMHALRLWYMFPNSKPLRTVTGLLSVSYVVGEFTAIGFFAKSWSSAKPSNGVIWLPTTIIHVLLYSLTLIRAFRARSTQGSVGFLMKQTLKEGGIFLIVSLLSLLAVSIGAQSRNTSISIGAQLSGFPMSTMSVAMSRLMLRIRSLSASLNTSPEWLLSHLEMSRLHFRTGQREGELLVEVGSAGDYELSSLPAIGCPVQVVSTTHTDSDGSTAAFGKDGPSHLA
ncbi:hypothetical protein OE88DRAFT_1077165 [Heliocybe sulcata]|uniref:Uncharacterized protein n=1 Tax=Heliocybe sulcata TaxID=5364 RepID=A0A5C3MM32_9AGAM|nr:hypothetical protein OE88DRAFT_1077165 [Heliocybe sulcata]